MYYPRSFLKFILLGFLLVSLPLVYALAELILSLDRLQVLGEEAVQESAQAGRASRQLLEQSGTLERLVRQHLILEDAALLDDYARVRQEFGATVRQLTHLPLAQEQLSVLRRLLDAESRLYARLRSHPRDLATSTQLADGYAEITDGAQAMLAATNQVTERAIARLQATATEGRQKWRYLGLATAGIAVVLAIVFAVLIARPIRQLDQAVRRMGSADFTHAIEVNGPADLRYLGQRLEWLRMRLGELEQQQSRFLRHVSHELKTPLTAVREGAELLRDNVGGSLTPEQGDIVRIIRDNTLQLQKLIEDLLTYHQTRAMEPQVQESMQLTDIVRRVLHDNRLAALARMLAFEHRLVPATVLGDADKIRTIVDNLVSNAIKHSPRSGTIDVILSTKGGYACIDVMDEGLGVDPEDRLHIFDSFYQGRPPAEGRVKGSGLGLAIAREYALAHGGRIEVGDRPDGRRGAHFRLLVPLQRGVAAEPSPAPSADVAELTASGRAK